MRLFSTAIQLVVILFCQTANAQTSVIVRNSTWLDYDVEVAQSGTFAMDPNQWVLGQSQLRGWIETTGEEILTVNRTTLAVPEGDTAYFDVYLSSGSDYVVLKLRVAGVTDGTTLAYSVEGNGFFEPWYDDGSFHEVNTVLGGKPVVVKFKPDNDDSQLGRDIRFAIHDLPVYELPSTDFTDPNVLNVMYYNVQMLPFGVSGMGQANERADHLPSQISPNQDVVSFSEVFDNTARESHLIPAMEAAGFPYRTTILNDPGLLPFPWNGGVMIFSKWPIEDEDEIDYEFCGQAASDCLANKGVKYARINKLGKRYHVFGTHMDAGSGADDTYARRTQMAEIREMINNLNIPDGEPVIFGGDFNLDPIDSDNDYQAFLDSIDPIVPQHTGYFESNFNDDFGKIIDHGWGERNHLVPLQSTNEVITLRSLEPVLWDISEFSDHRCVLARFQYPDIDKLGGDTIICPGENLTLSVNTVHGVTYQWFKDGNELTGETASSLQLVDALESQSGHYTCLVGYDVVYGSWTDPLNQLFYPNGADTVEARLTYDFGEIVIDEVLCHVGVNDRETIGFHVLPNPNNGSFRIVANMPMSGASFNIYDHCGRMVSSGILSEQQIDVAGASSGIYTIELHLKDNTVHQQMAVY